MKNRTIARFLQGSMGAFLDNFSNSLTPDIINDCYITGGAVTSLKLHKEGVAGESVNDYDIYCKDKTTLLKLVRELIKDYHKEHKYKSHYEKTVSKLSIIFRDIEDNRYEEYDYISDDTGKVFLSLDIPMAMKEMLRHDYFKHTLKTDEIVYMTEHSINLAGRFQLITRFVGEPEEVHKYFDFEHVKGIYDFKTGRVNTTPAMEECCLDKKIVYSGSKYPLSSIFRTIKYVNRGWMIDKVEILKMVFQLAKLDLTNPAILKDQLTGVYGADISNYFAGMKDNGVEASLFDDILWTLNEEITNKPYPIYEDSPSIQDFLNKY